MTPLQRRILHLDVLQITWGFEIVVECAAQPLQMGVKSNNNFLQNLGFSYHPDPPLFEIWALWRAHTGSVPHCWCTGPCPSLAHTTAFPEICPCLILVINYIFSFILHPDASFLFLVVSCSLPLPPPSPSIHSSVYVRLKLFNPVWFTRIYHAEPLIWYLSNFTEKEFAFHRVTMDCDVSLRQPFTFIARSILGDFASLITTLLLVLTLSYPF